MPLYEFANNIGEQFAHEVHAWVDALSYVTVQGVSQNDNGPWQIAVLETLTAQQQTDVQAWLDSFLPQPQGVAPADLAKVRTEVTTDPASLGYAGMSDQQAADAMNATTQTKTVIIPSNELLAWAAGASAGQSPRLKKIRTAFNHESEQIAAIAEVADLMIRRDSTALDLSRPDRQQMVGALQAAGVLSPEDVAALYAMAQQPASRAEILGTGVVGRRDVAMARAS